MHGLGGRGEDAARERLFARVDELLREVEIPALVRGARHRPNRLGSQAVPVAHAGRRSTTHGRTNPRMPLLSELTGLLDAAYG